MQFDTSSKADRQFSAALKRLSPQGMWQMVESAVAMAAEKQYNRVKAEMESAGLDDGDPDKLVGILSKLDPEQTLKALHESNPNLDLTKPESDPLPLTLEIISLLAGSS